MIVLLFFGLNGLACISFLLLSFSDAIDGYIARRFNQVSDLGKFLDPIADKILVICVLVVLIELGKAAALPVIILLAREFIVSAVRIDAARSKQIIAASFTAKLKTVVEVIAVAMLILALPFAGWVLWLAVALAVVSGGEYFWQSNLLKQLRSS